MATSVASYMAHGAADPVALTATFLGALIGTVTMTGMDSLLLHESMIIIVVWDDGTVLRYYI